MILSYTLVGGLLEALQQCAFRFVVLDESHYIKDEKASCALEVYADCWGLLYTW